MAGKSIFKEVADLLLDIPGIIAFSRDYINGRIKELRQKNRRADVIRLLPKLDPTDQDRLMAHVRRLAATSEPIYENDLMNGLGDAIPRDKEGVVSDEAAALAFLKWVANLDEPRFDVFAYMVLHDPIAQRVKYYIGWAIENHEEIALVLGVVIEAVAAFFEERANTLFGVQNAAQVNDRLRQKRDNLRQQIAEERQMGVFRRAFNLIGY